MNIPEPDHALSGPLVRISGQPIAVASGHRTPPDFPTDAHGRVEESRHDRVAGDHVAMERLDLIVVRGIAARAAA